MYENSFSAPVHRRVCRSVNSFFLYDEKNFLYCVIRHLWPDTKKFDNYKGVPSKYLRKFNLEGLSFPLTYSQINKFVGMNKHLPLTISVFFESESNVCRLGTFSNKQNKKKRFKNVLNLLMTKSDPKLKKSSKTKIKSHSSFSSLKNLNHQHHFFNITNLRGFLNNRTRCYKGTANTKLYYCEVCLMDFHLKEKKISHEETCQKDKQEVEYLPKGFVKMFDNQRNAFKAPVIGFADFECYMEEFTEQKACPKCNKSSLKCDCEKSSNQMMNIHKACGFSICFVDSDNDVFFQETYSGDDAVEVFLENLETYEEIVDKRKQRFKQTSQINASQVQWDRYHAATRCAICNGEFDNSSYKMKKVVDHDHVNGINIQAAHSICNLQRQGPYRTPIYFHNGQG